MEVLSEKTMEERKQLEHSYSDGTKYTGAVMAGADRWTGAKDMWIYDGTGKLVWQGGCWSGTSFVGEWKSHAVDGRGLFYLSSSSFSLFYYYYYSNVEAEYASWFRFD